MLEDLTLHEPPRAIQTYAPDRSNWATSLKTLDLEQEVLHHYNITKEYLENLPLEEIEPNKVATVINTLTSILKDLTKIQTDLHNAETIKKFESAITKAVKVLPEATQEEFFTLCRQYLE